MCTLEKLNFAGEHAPGPPLPTRAFGPTIWAGLTRNCFRRAGYFQSVILTMILQILRTQKMFLFSVEKGAPSVLYRDIYFKDC